MFGSKFHKFQKKNLKNLKSNLGCFSFFSKRNIKGKINFFFYNNKISLDFGFKNSIECFENELQFRLPNFQSLKDQCNYFKNVSFIIFRTLNLDSFFFQKILITLKKQKRFLLDFQVLYFVWYRLMFNRNFIRGRVIHFLKGGFAIGFFGYIAFLPNSHAFGPRLGLYEMFYFMSFNLEKKTFIVSQKRINKIIKRRLLKLGSKIIYLKKS